MNRILISIICCISLLTCINCVNKDKEIVLRLTEENGENEGHEQGFKDGMNGLAYKYSYNELCQFHASSEKENAELQEYRSKGYRRGYDIGYKEGKAKYESATSQGPNQESSNEYKQRVEQFAKSQRGVIASYPNDNRYCVYFSKKTTYGHNDLYRYDAVNDMTEKVKLPIQATRGYTSLWLTKNGKYIFVAAEERYTDFIMIDTQTKRIRYITDCESVERTESGFTVTKSRCTNENVAQSSIDMEFAYTNYYYDEEGNCIGHGSEYR